GFRAGNKPVLTDQTINERGFSGIGPADDRDLDRPRWIVNVGVSGFFIFIVFVSGFLNQRFFQRVIESGKALVVLGGNWYRLAQSKFERLIGARPAHFPLTFIGNEDYGLARAPHDVGESVIDGRNADARIDHEYNGVGLPDRGFGLCAHAACQTLVVGLLEPRRVDHAKFEAGKISFAFTPVARDTWPVIDKREPPSNQAIEERRFTDIGPADEGDGGQHRWGRY